MSYNFRISNVGPLRPAEVFLNTGFPDICFHQDGAQPVNGLWPEGVSFLYREKVSTRRLQVEYTHEKLSLQVFSLSSDDDYDLAIRVIAAIAALSKCDIEDNESQGPIKLSEFLTARDQGWLKRTSEHFFSTTIEHFKESLSYEEEEDAYAQLAFNGVHRQITVGSDLLEELSANPSELRETLYKLIFRLNYIESLDPALTIASDHVVPIKLDSGEMSEAITLIYTPGARTLLTSQAVHICIAPRGVNELIGEAPIEEFIELLADKLEWIDSAYFIAPELTEEEYIQLFSGYEGKGSDFKNIGKEEPKEEDTERQEDDGEAESDASELPKELAGFSAEEVQALVHAPVAIVFFVAAADGEIAEKEIEAFQHVLVSDPKEMDPFFRAIIELVPASLDSIIAAYKKCIETGELRELLVAHLLRARQSVAEKRSTADAQKFSEILYDLGVYIAEACRSGFGIFGKKISKEEKLVLEALAKLLEIPAERWV